MGKDKSLKKKEHVENKFKLLLITIAATTRKTRKKSGILRAVVYARVSGNLKQIFSQCNYLKYE